MKYSILILVCVTILLWKLIDEIPNIIAALSGRKCKKIQKWAEPYPKETYTRDYTRHDNNVNTNSNIVRYYDIDKY